MNTDICTGGGRQNHPVKRQKSLFIALGVALNWGCASASIGATPGAFQVEEATIADIHAAIKSGQTTCKGLLVYKREPAHDYI